ncbi:DUF7668 domain-containing protein [Hymenobacter perfusus]|uniref:DUF7668 domain-containing protein n=1 Tax=Hymenobacter perfusus TaxID=1236770 RepID=A0A3R9MFK5_9BACT|nr:hypothetical protein [Hymenobacter perfusus]RSK40945.1 hypothetical protein EI293_18575 [Hymenobacter perfusus]
MQPIDFTFPVKRFVDLLLAENYQAVIEQSFHKDRLQAVDIEEAIRLFPGCLTAPPISAYETLDVYKYDNGSGYMLEFFLWIDQEQSDLIITIDAIWSDNELHYSFWNIYGT